MQCIKINAVLSCLIGVIYCHVDSFISSPDVDTQAGFFPDSGFLKPNSHLETSAPGVTYNPHHHPSQLPNMDVTSNNVNSFYQRAGMDTVIAPGDILSKRLQRLMANLPHRKMNKVLPLASHAEDPGFLFLFTGAKHNKS